MDSHVLPFIICNLGGALIFALGWIIARKGRRRRLLAAAGDLTLLLVKMVLTWQPVWEAALFPWPAYVYLQDYWIYLIGLLFFGIAIPQLTVRWNRVVVIMIASVVLLAGLQATAWLVDPEIHGQDKTATSDHHYRQTTFYTCAPSSCVSALSYAGIAATEREMANLCLTHDSGTTVFNTYRGLTLKLVGRLALLRRQPQRRTAYRRRHHRRHLRSARLPCHRHPWTRLRRGGAGPDAADDRALECCPIG